MILQEEFEELEKLFIGKHVELSSFLTDKEIECIINSGKTNIVLFNLKNRIIGKPSLKRSTICLQRLHDGYDFNEWLQLIAKTVWFDDDTYVNLGFSFIAQKSTGEQIYIFAAKSLASFQIRCSSADQCLAKFEKIGQMTDADLLKTTFFESTEGEHFKSSGFLPTKIVCSYLWINK